ncbi:peptide ABC transporter substrate-binding protein [Maricaulis sp. MIT060901]|uniref:peptide ABC transporter substrate-binding protein n=1 Tax=Maricaulis sp. MIT060901 TaxID=3096993 RepID=UPI00399AF73B
MTTSAAALAGCGRSTDADADTMRVGISNLPDSLDPARGQFASAALVHKQVHAGLTEYGPDGQLAPGLAERWEVTPDGLAWTFILREGLAWSDGRPLTAHDVAWSARRLVDPAQSFAALGDFQNVVNARAILAGDAPVESLGVEVVSDQAVRFNLESPLGLFPLLMREFYPFPRHIIERVGDDWITPANWVSAGAFTLASISQVQIGLRRNPHFYDATNVSIQTIRVEAVRDDATRARMFRAGELDLADNPPANQLDFLHEQLGDGFESFDAPILRYLKVNHAREPLNDMMVRAELDYAIDRAFLVRELFSGTATPTRSVLPQMFQDQNDPVRLRPEGAAPVINRPLQIRTTTGLGERIAVSLADDWRQIGVDSEIFATYPTDLYQAVDAGDFDIAIASFNRGLKSDPFFMLDPFAPDGFAANFNWHDETFAELMNRARRESDPIEREEIYREANAHIQLEHAIIPLVHDRAHWLVGERVTGTRADVQPQVWRYLGLADG